LEVAAAQQKVLPFFRGGGDKGKHDSQQAPQQQPQRLLRLPQRQKLPSPPLPFL